MAPDELDELTVDELLEIAGDLDITGRHDMRKQELIFAIDQETDEDGAEETDPEDETPGGNADEDSAQQPDDEDSDEESDETDEEADEEVDESPLTDDELPWDVADAEVGDEVMMNHLSLPLEITAIHEGNPHELELTTNRGGRHKLTIPRTGEARLMRWRAGDQEWMYNSTYPEQFDLPSPESFVFETDVTLPESVADDEDEAKRMGKMQVDGGDLEVEAVEATLDDGEWTVLLAGTGNVTGFDPSPDDLNTGDF